MRLLKPQLNRDDGPFPRRRTRLRRAAAALLPVAS